MYQKNSTLQELVSPLLSFNYVQEDSYSCGFFSAKAVVRSLTGKRIYRTDVNCTKEGTGQTNLIQGLRSKGVSCSVKYDLTIPKMKKIFSTGKYIIVYNHSEDHWMVAYDIVYNLSREGRVKFYDPEYMLRSVNFPQYRNYFKKFGIVCSKR